MKKEIFEKLKNINNKKKNIHKDTKGHSNKKGVVFHRKISKY